MTDTAFNSAANLTADPELRMTAAGKPVASLRLAINNRRRTSEGWADGEATFLRASVFGDQARHVVETFSRGQRVLVLGRLQTRNGTLEVLVDEIGPSLRWATAVITKPSAELDRPAEDNPADYAEPGALADAG
jgi:single-strand DNA-binding protein